MTVMGSLILVNARKVSLKYVRTWEKTMTDVDKICRGTYDASLGQCLAEEASVQDFSWGAQGGETWDDIAKDQETEFFLRTHFYGGYSNFDFSGLLEGKRNIRDGAVENEEGPVDLQVCWSDKGNQQSVCSEFSSLPTPYLVNRSVGARYQIVGKNVGAHTSAAWSSARFFDPILPGQLSSAAFSGGVNVHGHPGEGFGLVGAEYFLTCGPETGLCDGNALKKFFLQGLTVYPLFAPAKLILSADTLFSPQRDSKEPAAIRFRGAWSAENISVGLHFRRQAPLFETEPIDRWTPFVKKEFSLGSRWRTGIEVSGSPLLVREDINGSGWDLSIAPHLTIDSVSHIRGYYTHAIPPTGGKMQEMGGLIETSDNLPIAGLRLFVGFSEFFWEDPLFQLPRSGYNTQGGGTYCLGSWCLDVTGQYNQRGEGDPFPSGDWGRSHIMANLRYQDPPGRASNLSPIAARRLAAYGVRTSSASYPMPHYASPRVLFSPSPVGGVWPFNLPQRKPGPESFNTSGWYNTLHTNVLGLRESNPAAVEVWIKKGHGNALKALLAQGIDGVCYMCHVDKYGTAALQEWIDSRAISKEMLREGQIPNPWYSEEKAERASEKGSDYLQPEYLTMAAEVRCQKCHDTNHTGYLKHILSLPGGRHHGMDALKQDFQYVDNEGKTSKGLYCFGCHSGPGSDINRDFQGTLSSQPLLSCNHCHQEYGPVNHASPSWGPSLSKEALEIEQTIRWVINGGEHGKTYLKESKERGINNVSCRSCHEQTFCTDCHSRMNTHGKTEAQRRAWGRGGDHSYSGVALAQGAVFVKTNQERGNNCWVCHESQQNCYDSCHSGKRVTGHHFHGAGMINRHQAELDTASLRCNSCHQEKRGIQIFQTSNNATSCGECHAEAIAGNPRPNPPHPVGWANIRLGQRTMHGEAVCDRGSPGVCFQCHSSNENRNPDGPLSCFNSTCHGDLKGEKYNIPACNKKD